ncbi:hypothetical protein [Hymenobacter sp. B81]|uniref:hypothetical protein n=1 Tax=Hymenobacter sp. B81 TaxID=3344878 RepID=UPI0037DDD7AC
METPEEKQAAALVDAWLAAHPDRIAERRQFPDHFAGWKRAAVERLLHGNPYDAPQILDRFATKVEGPVMH